jgi:predicted DNA-binding transcriptional regulator YafY
MRAAGAKGTLNLSGQIGGHRPTSVAAVAELMKGLHTLDLSENSLGPDETTAIAKAISSSKTLTDLSLAKNAIGNMGAQAVAAALGESKLVSLNLFKTGIREDGAKAFVEVIKNASSLTKLNLQYNALRAESKRTLDVANATREIPIFLVT